MTVTPDGQMLVGGGSKGVVQISMIHNLAKVRMDGWRCVCRHMCIARVVYGWTDAWMDGSCLYLYVYTGRPGIPR